MTAQAVEWVLVIYYGRTAHRATYGRNVKGGGNTKYTKDYIQLSKKPSFLAAAKSVFGLKSSSNSCSLTFRWPSGSTRGAFVLNSSDRPHLKWETSLGPPLVWKMIPNPSQATAETIPGDPTHIKFTDAEREFEQLAQRGAGQPYLIAVKLQAESGILHLRAYLSNAHTRYSWADLQQLPDKVKQLAAATSKNSAIAWLLGENDLFFDPALNHNAWAKSLIIERSFSENVLSEPIARFGSPPSDAVAEMLATDPKEVEVFETQIEQGNYAVLDSKANVKTRGSAQKVFATVVKRNYGWQCAVTGLKTRTFLVASHIVPWSADQSIRLDPSNGICLSLLVDRAFEKGHLLIEDDLTIRIDLKKIGSDGALRRELQQYDGRKLKAAKRSAPRPVYLQRRRALVASP